ncbi:hypothetical protein OSTOST_16910 [Ostertagia ostertagi]
MIARWYDRKKKVIIKLNIKSYESAKSVLSRNVVFEIPGSVYPEEIVLLSAHIDSWDVGQGALDDGGGMAAVRAAMLAIKRLSLSNPDFKPKSRLRDGVDELIRGIFWTAEEQGSLGSSYYFHDHSSTKERFVFASESDQGAFRPRNYLSILRYHYTRLPQEQTSCKDLIEQIVTLLNTNGIPLRVLSDPDQVDVAIFAEAGVPTVNYESDREL